MSFSQYQRYVGIRQNEVDWSHNSRWIVSTDESMPSLPPSEVVAFPPGAHAHGTTITVPRQYRPSGDPLARRHHRGRQYRQLAPSLNTILGGASIQRAITSRRIECVNTTARGRARHLRWPILQAWHANELTSRIGSTRLIHPPTPQAQRGGWTRIWISLHLRKGRWHPHPYIIG